MIQPIPATHGVGFCSYKPLDNFIGYRYEVTGRFHNYHFTKENYQWPEDKYRPPYLVFDAFSPNLNKFLHVGHLRNLAIAKSLSKIFDNSLFVSLFGASLGINFDAWANTRNWMEFVGYHPVPFQDIHLIREDQIDEMLKQLGSTPGTGDYLGCDIYNGKIGPVVLRRSADEEGKKKVTYAFYDLVFSQQTSPDHYLTGAEQKEHFDNLSLGHKHLPMGLVLDAVTGKKIKSRTGDSLKADEAILMVMDKLEETPEPKKLAWNILCWNFLHISRNQNIRFDIDEWTKSDSPGMYVSYTMARISSALENVVLPKVIQAKDFEDLDIELIGVANYLDYYTQRAIKQVDPSPLAKFAHDLARKLGNAYHSEKINGGRPNFQYAVNYGLEKLKACCTLLGMFPLSKV